MERLLVVSACSSAGASPRVFAPYLDPSFLGELDRWASSVDAADVLANPQIAGQTRYDQAYIDDLDVRRARDRAAGVADPTRRLAEMDAQGVAADVLFPSFQSGLRPPFDPVHGSGSTPPELQLSGARAYNRWLADYCGTAPTRLAGIAVVPLSDVGAAVDEIQWAKDAGLRGVLVPAIPGPPMDGMVLPKLGAADPAHEPVWSACEAADLPVHTVGGTGLRNWGAVAGWPLLEELSWPESANGALMPLFLGGVLEHHPRLRVVLADQGTRRIADIVRAWESTYQSSQFNSYGLERSPWEYWTRQCFVAPAPFRRSDCELREVLGVSQMMWSSRYPQTVGGWIDVRSSLCHVLAGVPEREMRAIVGGNAVRLYSLDSGALSEVAARIGVESEDLSMTAA